MLATTPYRFYTFLKELSNIFLFFVASCRQQVAVRVRVIVPIAAEVNGVMRFVHAVINEEHHEERQE